MCFLLCFNICCFSPNLVLVKMSNPSTQKLYVAKSQLLHNSCGIVIISSFRYLDLSQGYLGLAFSSLGGISQSSKEGLSLASHMYAFMFVI